MTSLDKEIKKILIDDIYIVNFMPFMDTYYDTEEREIEDALLLLQINVYGNKTSITFQFIIKTAFMCEIESLIYAARF